MRRVPDNLLKAVVFLYPTEDAAKKGQGYGGSGFLVGVTGSNAFDPTADALHDPAHVYVVTNAHVAAQCPYVRTSHELQPILRINEWTNHPGGDDVAVARLGIVGFDTYALGKIVFQDYLLTPEAFAEHQIGPGEQLFMTGRFTGLDERQRNEATVRAGTLSMASTMPVRDDRWHGVLQESFFAEVNSKAGYSGSPVYVEIPVELPAPYPTNNFPPRRAYLGLLGMTWGLWRTYVPLLSKKTHKEIGWVIHENSGIELVIPAWRIRDLLMSEDLMKGRLRAEEQMRSKTQALKPEAVATDAMPTSDEVPAISEDYRRFENLTRRIVAVPKKETEREER